MDDSDHDEPATVLLWRSLLSASDLLYTQQVAKRPSGTAWAVRQKSRHIGPGGCLHRSHLSQVPLLQLALQEPSGPA